MGTNYLFKLTDILFIGFAISLFYGAASGATVWFLEPNAFQKYIECYVLSFNCLTSTGLTIAIAIFVILTKKSVPDAIEQTFTLSSLEATSYFKQKGLYLGLFGTAAFSANYAIVAFLIFYFAKFPLVGYAEYFLIFVGCLQYALGVYVGRKLYFIAHMLSAISEIAPAKNIFREDNLNEIISYVNILSTITVIFVYVSVKGFYEGPFQYTSVLGPTLKLMLLLPALLATPVIVLFNFYPRVVLRRLYTKSIEEGVDRLTKHLRNQSLSDFERMSYLIEYDRLQKDELRNRLQLTLSDLPMGVTVVIMIVGLIVKP